MDSNRALKRLLHVLSERDIGLGEDDLGWLFESPDTRDDMIAWVNEYLNVDTLLSPEELELYSEVVGTQLGIKSGVTSDPAARPLSDTDLEASIKTLENSTAAIDQQCAILQTQLDAIKQIRLQNDISCASDATTGPTKQLSSFETPRESQQDGCSVSDLSSRVTSLNRQANTAIASMETAARKQLEKDDRLLNSLQAFISKLDQPELRDSQINEIESLCQALTSLQGTIAKKRANEAYNAAFKQASEKTIYLGSPPNDDLESAAIADELDSLVEEIDTVLEMVVDNEYRRPLLHVLQNNAAEERERQRVCLSYIQQTLRQMTARLQNLSAHVQETHSYSAALEEVASLLEKIPSTEPTTSTMQLAMSRPVHKAIRDLVLPASAPSNAVSDFFRHYGIPVTSPQVADGTTGTSAVDTVLSERKAQLLRVSQSTEQSISQHISDSIGQADSQLQSLLQAVYAYSPYATVNLADPAMSTRLAQLDKSIENVGVQLRGFNLSQMMENESKRVEKVLNDTNHD
ncbi:hypothetical protein AAFC00_004641 [Neodothiora populina]|uniref:HAUS augmin-like complex subunit 3 N-terminal domain-containing protein n=1 Tax=Neodothiora populina TaxID=2781224 RepID=A0ABR3P3H3_9PEZI